MKAIVTKLWQVVSRDWPRWKDPEGEVWYATEKYDVGELRFQLTRAEMIMKRPAAVREVTIVYEPCALLPMDSNETKKKTTKREADLRSGKRKLRL